MDFTFIALKNINIKPHYNFKNNLISYQLSTGLKIGKYSLTYPN